MTHHGTNMGHVGNIWGTGVIPLRCPWAPPGGIPLWCPWGPTWGDPCTGVKYRRGLPGKSNHSPDPPQGGGHTIHKEVLKFQ